ncbi:unnamed protein product, partial [Arabidopsis halleri]
SVFVLFTNKISSLSPPDLSPTVSLRRISRRFSPPDLSPFSPPDLSPLV